MAGVSTRKGKTLNKKIVIYTLLCLICGALGAAIAWRAPVIGYPLGGLLWAYVLFLAYKVKNNDLNADWALLGYVWSAATGVLTLWLLSFNFWPLTMLAMWNLCSAAMPITLLAMKANRE